MWSCYWRGSKLINQCQHVQTLTALLAPPPNIHTPHTPSPPHTPYNPSPILPIQSHNPNIFWSIPLLIATPQTPTPSPGCDHITDEVATWQINANMFSLLIQCWHVTHSPPHTHPNPTHTPTQTITHTPHTDPPTLNTIQSSTLH